MNGFSFFSRRASIIAFTFVMLASASAVPARRAHHFHRAFKVRGASHFNLKNVLGSITINTWKKSRVQVDADIPPDQIVVSTGEGLVEISVQRSPSPPPINFVASVPSECNLKLSNLGGKIVVHGLIGNVEAETNDGDIELVDMRSDYVVASSTSGRVAFIGDIIPGGKYDLHSLTNTVDVTVSEDSSFQLSATSMHDSVDLGGFQFSNFISGRRVSGTYSNGGARLNLSTLQGSVHLHKR